MIDHLKVLTNIDGNGYINVYENFHQRLHLMVHLHIYKFAPLSECWSKQWWDVHLVHPYVYINVHMNGHLNVYLMAINIHKDFDLIGNLNSYLEYSYECSSQCLSKNINIMKGHINVHLHHYVNAHLNVI